MIVQKRYKGRFLKLLFCICTIISACSNDHDRRIAENINSEFEQTYLYVTKNMHIDIDLSKNLSNFRKSNKDAFTSIAYTWHSISVEACDLAYNRNKKASKSSYERLIQQSHKDNDHFIKVTDSQRKCLAKIYFDNWSNINKMLSLSFSRN